MEHRPSSPLLGVQGQQKLAVTRRFVFDALAIDNLKNTIEDSSDSRVVVVMSLIWKLRFLQELISSAKNGQSIAINLRGKSNIPPLKHALGKFTMSEIANLKASLSRKDELNDFVKLVGNTIRDTCVRQALIDDISSLVVNNKIKLVQKLCQGDVYSCSSWCGFPADFGSGTKQPIYAEAYPRRGHRVHMNPCSPPEIIYSSVSGFQ
ncbi:hypothetical protein KY285_002939 [Solanum tuberosum]|nr:hypothetical protein KY285_002939 [Solanum tuberosum]